MFVNGEQVQYFAVAKNPKHKSRKSNKIQFNCGCFQISNGFWHFGYSRIWVLNSLYMDKQYAITCN